MKVCVLGAGIAGLTAAFQLSARPGTEVVVFEQEFQFGGRANVDAGGEHCPRSEERRVGKECPSKCRSRWSPYH